MEFSYILLIIYLELELDQLNSSSLEWKENCLMEMLRENVENAK